jgi:uncharacterized protein YbjT (DUF2867 family)
MPGSHMILLTGSTGSVGLALAQLLSQRGIAYRAMVRDVAKASSLDLAGVEWVQGDFQDPASLRPALDGVDRVFLLAPPVEHIDRIEATFLDIAAAAGVRHIVNLSAVGAGIGVPHRFGEWHGQTEKYLQESTLDFTILRPNFFMQNLFTMTAMVQQGTLYVPAGEGKAPFVDVRDIAAVAASCLTETGHAGKIYEVTGPVAIGYADIAATLSQVLGRSINYVDIPLEAARSSMLETGMSAWLVDALNELNSGMKENRFGEVSDVVATVGHKTPIDLETFVRDHVAMLS